MPPEDGRDTDWVLVRSGPEHEELSVFNRRTYLALLIEDEAEHDAVCAALRELGRPVIEASQLERRELRVDGG